MVKLLREANRIITIWRQFGPNRAAIDLQLAFSEIVLPISGGDQCRIVFDQFETFEGLMAREVGTSEWRIGVSLAIAYPPRRNFTLAHEIGHFIGHRYLQDSFHCTFDNMNDFESQNLENEANEFAAQLLMPPDIIRAFDASNAFCHSSVSDLSEMLGVSRAAAAFQWIKLTNRRLGFTISRDGFIDRGRASSKLYSEGVYFKSGTELPVGSLATQIKTQGQEIIDNLDGTWHPSFACQESSYSATVNGYVYAYLDFDRF